ncbi:MAG: hypothetical protein GWN94_03115 [Phycisphaerae bacterium]|nr:hypothetical protein [Phycisphaerae bacterium]
MFGSQEYAVFKSRATVIYGKTSLKATKKVKKSRFAAKSGTLRNVFVGQNSRYIKKNPWVGGGEEKARTHIKYPEFCF